MSAAAFLSGLSALLTADATFQAALTALLGQPVNRALRANMPWKQLPRGQWPLFVLEQGDGRSSSITQGGGDIDGLVIGNHRQGFDSSVDVALLWTQADREAAAAARGELPTLLAQLLMRNPQPGGVSLAYLESWTPDQGANHPDQIFVASVRGEYAIRRS
jgi:hypothetical protein